LRPGTHTDCFAVERETNKLVFQRSYLAVTIMSSESVMNRGKPNR
jgi:hypothetical protein